VVFLSHHWRYDEYKEGRAPQIIFINSSGFVARRPEVSRLVVVRYWGKKKEDRAVP
jgi:hypothetical protein